MIRRAFLVILSSTSISLGASKLNKYIFRVKTKSGGIVGGILIEAKDVEAAKVKLMKRYPDCMILNVEVK